MPRQYQLILRKPTLPVGLWTNITPAAMQIPLTDWTTATGGICLDSSGDLFVTTGGFRASDGAVFQGRIWKSTDQGNSFSYVSPDACDQPIGIIANPSNTQQMWAWCGVRTAASGFGAWQSTDGGATWVQNAAFQTLANLLGTTDTYQISADPLDFNKLIASFHSPWTAYSGSSGVLYSLDGGVTWTQATGVRSEWAFAYGYCAFFLHDPAHSVGNSDTWLFATQGAGLWKTTDRGVTWTQVSTTSMAHGGAQPYYGSDGALYIGANPPSLLRSTDNGDTWSTVSTVPYSYYYSIIGDGTHLYTICEDGGSALTALETDGATGWGPYSAQQLPGGGGAFSQAIDPVRHILYAATKGNGIWACRLQ